MKRTDSDILFFDGKKMVFKESPPSIMITRNLNWSTKILLYGTSYIKWKILSPLKCTAWGRLNCWFYLKLLTVCWFACNIPDSDVSEYSTTDTSNSDVGKYYVAKNKIKTNSIPNSVVNKMNLNLCMNIFLKKKVSYTWFVFHSKNPSINYTVKY
jgi:hypothetical protein